MILRSAGDNLKNNKKKRCAIDDSVLNIIKALYRIYNIRDNTVIKRI